MNMFYSLMVWFLGSIATIFMGIMVLAVSAIIGREYASPFTALWGKIICFLSSTKVEIEGVENIDPKESYLFAMNHQSFFDIFAVIGYLPFPLVFVPKKSLFKIPVVGWCMRMMNFIEIDRNNPLLAMKRLEEESRELKSRRSIILFPEGTRSQDGSLGPFKRGLLIVVKNTKMPLLPVTINGSYKIMEKGSMNIHPGKIKIIIGKPIDTTNLSSENGAALIADLKTAIESNLIN